MAPLLWTSRQAALAAAASVSWMLTIELGTSRTASRAAANDPEQNERVVDTSTSRLVDAAAATAIVGGVATSLGRPSLTIPARRTSFLTGLVLLAGAGALSSFARTHLGRFHRDSLTVHGDHELVDTGPYRLVRHPLYTATIGAFVGIGAVLGNWLSLALAATPAFALAYRIGVEEDMLVDALGEQYSNYQERTKRLIPRVW